MKLLGRPTRDPAGVAPRVDAASGHQWLPRNSPVFPRLLNSGEVRLFFFVSFAFPFLSFMISFLFFVVLLCEITRIEIVQLLQQLMLSMWEQQHRSFRLLRSERNCRNFMKKSRELGCMLFHTTWWSGTIQATWLMSRYSLLHTTIFLLYRRIRRDVNRQPYVETTINGCWYCHCIIF
jgi:hypothetical protein